MHQSPTLRALCAALIFLFTSAARGNPVITEFMADNASTIQDNHGIYSDWIEIHNPTAAPINLLDWCLTDDPLDLDQWRFPAVTIAPGEFLVVWATGLNERDPALPLHTNFSLKAGGEYLALVQPNGTTIQQQFAPEYPAQDPDESFGAQFTNTTLASPGAAARYLIPANGSLGATWTATGFNHAAWPSGTTGVGFGLLVPGMTVRSVKKNDVTYGTLDTLAGTLSLLAQPTGSPQILVDVTVVAPTVNYLGDGADGHYSGNKSFPCGGPDVHCIRATGTVVIPTAGTWTFGLNSDDGGRIQIDGTDLMVDDSNHGPQDHFGSRVLTAGSHTFEVIMWEGYGGDEVEFFAAPGSFVTWGAQFKLVGDTANGGLAAFTQPAGAGSVIGTNIEGAMRHVNATAYVRVPFTAGSVAGLNAIGLRMRYNDGYVAYLNGTEVARRNAPTTPAFNSTATATRTQTQSLKVEPLNLTAFKAQFINGSNVLAIQGLNDTVSDGSFLVLPEIVGGVVSASEPAFYSLPTPGGINGTPSSLGKVSDTQFSVDRGFFTASFPLSITTLTPSVTIRYTTDGSTPTETTGIVYSGPITIATTTVVRAAAFRPGWEPTNVDTQTYIFLDDVLTQSSNGAPAAGWPATSGTAQVLDYGMDPEIVNHADPNLGGATTVKNALKAISTICLTSDLPNFFNMNGSQGIYSNPGGRGFGWERPCSIELLNPPDALHPNGTSEFQVGAGMRIRGGYSRSTDNPKHGFHIYFREDYGPKKLNYKLFGHFGAKEYDQIDLRTAQNYSWSFGGDDNNTFLREESTRLAQRDMGHQYGRLRYFHLYINGQYWGLWNTEERTEASFAETYYGGDKDQYDVVKGEQDAGYTTGVTDGNLAAWQDLWNKSKAHLASPTNANYFKMMGRQADGVTPTADPVLLDDVSLIDYMLLTFWTGNLDGAVSAFLGNNNANNWFGMRNRLGTTGGFKYFVHDFEHTFFNTGEDRTGPFINANYGSFTYSNPMFLHQDLMANTEYKIKWADRVHKHMFNGGSLTQTVWSNRINSIAGIVDQTIVAESARWGDAKVAAPKTRQTWINAQNYILNSYLPVRGPTVLSQLRTDGLYPLIDAPAMTPFGGYAPGGTEVVMSAPSGGTIYYMADGSDPRAVGGAIRAGAQTYTPATTNETLVPLGANWKYLADASNQGTAWRASAFNDAAWPGGNAELGYGDGDEATVVPFVDVDAVTAGVQKNATTYFRRTFTASNVGGLSSVSLNLEYDDAAAVYINGTRVATTPNLPVDPAYNFYTGAAIEDTIATFAVAPSVLVNGANVIAVEIHQAGNGSSDISMNLSLVATRSTTATPYLLSGTGEKPLRVRAYEAGTSTWSAMTDALFLVNTVAATAANLAITEIMYHPSNPTAAEILAGFDDSEMFEWIELTNTSATSIDLAGLYFGDGIDFDFSNSLVSRVLAPGARVLIVGNKAAFEFRYGPGHPIAGVFSDSLDNGGEPLALYNAASIALQSFSYDDLAPWPAEADGPGYSLVLRRTNLDPALGTSWRASVTLGGNPAATDASNYPAWKTANGVTADNADGESDGVINWLEYVLGGTPAAIDNARLPRGGSAPFTVNLVTQPYATLSYTRRLGADDVDHIVESSDALATWSAAGAVFVSATRNADGTETALYRSAQPMPGPGRGFLRLRATLAP